MGLMDSFKAFLHSVTTDDHYASYGSPYSGSTAGGGAGNDAYASTARLHELHNSSSHSLVNSRNASSTNIGGYRPGMRSSSTNVSNGGTGHEMQTFGADGRPPLPSIDSLWDRIEAFLEEEYPELEDSLNSGASTADLNEFEKDLGVGPLPVEVRQFYKRHDGQFRGAKPTGLLMGMALLDIENIMEEYALWAKVAERVEKQQMELGRQRSSALAAETSSSASASARDKFSNSYLMHQKSIPSDAVQAYYVHRGWIPISRDLIGNMIGLDLAPGPAGVRGQVILYGRDFDTKVVIASSLQELIFQFVSDLEAGNYQVDRSESYDDNGFLDSSRMDDYMIGDEDEDNGELSFFDRGGSEFGKGKQGKLSYIEVLKQRALKRYGVSHAGKFQTAFTPQRMPKRPVAKTGSRAASQVSLHGNKSADLLKETLIDEPAKATAGAPTAAEEKKAEVPEEAADVPDVKAQKAADKDEIAADKTEIAADNIESAADKDEPAAEKVSENAADKAPAAAAEEGATPSAGGEPAATTEVEL